MSGHSKWANIKRQKGANDLKKSKTFSKLSRAISVAAKQGGVDPASNPTLRLAIEKAKAERMPKDNIDKAISKGGGLGMADTYQEVIYEGFGPGGEAFYVQALTDNKNRTVAEIRMLFSKSGGSLGGAGSTSYIFTPDPENPQFTIPVADKSVAKILLDLCEALDDHDDVQEVYTNFELLDTPSE